MLTNGSDKKIFSSLDAANLKYQKEVVIPEGIEGIGGGCFYSNYNLEKIIFPNSLKRIAISAFEGCSKLKEVVLPSGVEEIADCAFKNCYNLKKVILDCPDTQFNNSAFYGATEITEIFYRGSKDQWYRLVHQVSEFQAPGILIHCSDGDLRL